MTLVADIEVHWAYLPNRQVKHAVPHLVGVRWNRNPAECLVTPPANANWQTRPERLARLPECGNCSTRIASKD